MKRFIESEDRRQATLLPDSLEDYVTDDNPVRVIDVFIGELDLAAMGFAGVAPEATGRPAYHPATLLKIYLYGYLNRIQSSRRLERETQRNIELMWLTGRLMPEFKTIADFRRDNGPAIRAACAQFVVLCRRLNLLTRSVVAVDGSKFKAVNTRDKNFTVAKVDPAFLGPEISDVACPDPVWRIDGKLAFEQVRRDRKVMGAVRRRLEFTLNLRLPRARKPCAFINLRTAPSPAERRAPEVRARCVAKPEALFISPKTAWPATSRSRPVASAFNQLRSVWSESPKVLTADATVWPPWTKRMASCLNSSAYRARAILLMHPSNADPTQSALGSVLQGQGHSAADTGERDHLRHRPSQCASAFNLPRPRSRFCTHWKD